MFDLAAFWATLAALLSKTLGVAEFIGGAFNWARKGVGITQIELREKLARGLARPMMKLAWLYFIGIAFAMGLMVKTALWHDAYIGWPFLTTFLVMVIALVAPFLIVRRETNRVLAHDESPLDVSYSACAGSLIAGSIMASVILSLFAIHLNSNMLWLVSMAVRYLTLGVCTVALMIAAWIVRNTGSLLEKTLELFFVVFAPILPGITYENVREKLFPHGLEFIDEEELAAKITAITGVLVGILLPFDLVVLAAPYYYVAFAFGLGYLVKVFAARIAIVAGREDLVDASRKRLSGILFTYFPWIAAFTGCAGRVIYAWMPAPFDASAIWFRQLFHGEAHLVGWHPWYINLGFLVIALVVLLIGSGLAELGESKKWKAACIGIPVLLCLWPAGSLLQNLGVWDGTLGAVSPKTAEQEIVITNAAAGVGDVPALAKVGKNYAGLSWFTDKKADCQLEVIEVTGPRKDYEHREYVRGKRLQARVNTKGFLQQVTLDGLEDGVTVKYRLHCSIAEGKYRGLTTKTHEYEFVHDSSAKPETAPPPSPPATFCPYVAPPVTSAKTDDKKPAATDDGSIAKTDEPKSPLSAPPVVQAKTERKKRYRRTPEERAEDARLRARMNASVNAL
ncbi:hypothetical protein KKD88_03640 [Patescibacteria group bacterium]|nr:hypothetical protein [Patescibacteria group bacterium]